MAEILTNNAMFSSFMIVLIVFALGDSQNVSAGLHADGRKLQRSSKMDASVMGRGRC